LQHSFSSSALPLINYSSVGSEENLLILKVENMTRLKKLLGDRPVFFGSSRKRFLKNILESSAALTAELIREGSSSSSEEKKGEEERRSLTVEELDWATAGTTAAAVTGMPSYVMLSPHHPIRMFLLQEG
jgi:dihydropteroate synthase